MIGYILILDIARTTTSPRTQAMMRGEVVAALYRDMGWHRALVKVVARDWLELEYLDWGWQARVNISAVRVLNTRYVK